MEYLKSMEHTWTRDQRDPLFTFKVKDETWGFYAMSLEGWHVLLAVRESRNRTPESSFARPCSHHKFSLQFMILHALASAALAPLVYKLIVQKQGTAISYAVCYSLLPLIFVTPYYAFVFFNIRNQMFRFLLGTIMPVTCLFKTTAGTQK